MLLILVKDFTSNEDISNSLIDWQLLNIFCIFVTFDVTKFDTSIDVNFGHNSNILFISVTKEVLKFVIFNSVISLQLLNILCISVTNDVLNRLALI